MTVNFGKHWIHFTHSQAKELGLGPKRERGMQKSLTLYADNNGIFVNVYGKRVAVNKLLMGNHYRARAD